MIKLINKYTHYKNSIDAMFTLEGYKEYAEASTEQMTNLINSHRAVISLLPETFPHLIGTSFNHLIENLNHVTTLMEKTVVSEKLINLWEHMMQCVLTNPYHLLAEVNIRLDNGIYPDISNLSEKHWDFIKLLTVSLDDTKSYDPDNSIKFGDLTVVEMRELSGICLEVLNKTMIYFSNGKLIPIEVVGDLATLLITAIEYMHTRLINEVYCNAVDAPSFDSFEAIYLVFVESVKDMAEVKAAYPDQWRQTAEIDVIRTDYHPIHIHDAIVDYSGEKDYTFDTGVFHVCMESMAFELDKTIEIVEGVIKGTLVTETYLVLLSLRMGVFVRGMKVNLLKLHLNIVKESMLETLEGKTFTTTRDMSDLAPLEDYVDKYKNGCDVGKLPVNLTNVMSDTVVTYKYMDDMVHCISEMIHYMGDDIPKYPEFVPYAVNALKFINEVFESVKLKK